VVTSRQMDKFRDEIAEKMWIDYQQYLLNDGSIEEEFE
jgi:hypothetical protein